MVADVDELHTLKLVKLFHIRAKHHYFSSYFGKWFALMLFSVLRCVNSSSISTLSLRIKNRNRNRIAMTSNATILHFLEQKFHFSRPKIMAVNVSGMGGFHFSSPFLHCLSLSNTEIV